MRLLKWDADEPTARWTRKLHVSTAVGIAPQFVGSTLNPFTWTEYIIADNFPDFCITSDYKLLCSPGNIIQCFQEEHMLEGLALVVGWGGMARTNQYIYTRNKAFIEQTLRDCAESITNTDSIESAWKRLVKDLGWTDTISSKSLHFLARSLGYEQNPGVAIDNAIIHNVFAYSYDEQMRRLGGDPKELGLWKDKSTADLSWQAYNRYMTAICCWAQMQSWTTTQIESTVFAACTQFLKDN